MTYEIGKGIPTPAQEKGIKVGDKVTITDNVGANGEYFKAGETAILKADDGTNVLSFSHINRSSGQENSPDGAWWVDITNVEKYDEPVKISEQNNIQYSITRIGCLVEINIMSNLTTNQVARIISIIEE